jgi:DNA ligase-associated metallophosphoesterase
LQPPIQYLFKSQTFWLSGQRSLFWENEKTLIVADLHLGKTGHFRKAGIAIPQTVFKEDLHRLMNELQYFKPQQLVIVGDLFHSEANKELELFKKWRKDISSLPVHLVKGNHDILDDDWYKKAGINIHDETLTIKNFCFCHDFSDYEHACPAGRLQTTNYRLPTTDPRLYFFSGHIHPGISINGAGKQSLHFPCFYFRKNYAVLPAFSRFTGTYPISPQKDENVFAIVNNGVMQIA